MTTPIKKRPIDTFYEENIDTSDYWPWSEPLSEEQIATINLIHKAMDDYIMKLVFDIKE